jgi:hypothetical protein
MPSSTSQHRIHGVLVALLLGAPAFAIEPPQQQPAPAATEQAAPATVTPTDETAFYGKLQYVNHWRNLRGLGVPPAAIEALSRGEAQVAVELLSSASAQGKPEATIALVRIQHWCGRVSGTRPSDPAATIDKLAAQLPAERAARAAGVLNAEPGFLQRARAGCSRAAFDYGDIEDRLRDAADSGHAASATELAQFVRDPAKRNELLQSAADKHYAPAEYALATQRLMAVQRGQTTENVASIRQLLKQSGRSLPKAKLDLANCMALGCDGHPADSATASAFGMDAARDGEPAAYVSMFRMPWGVRMPRDRLLAWQYFGDRLNEAGCTGEAYIPNSIAFAQSIGALEKGQSAALLDEARKLADELWRENGTRAMQEQGCSMAVVTGN